MALVSATPLAESSSYWAQGGLAAAISDDDSPELHLADTIAAGRGAVRESAARVLCEEAPSVVEHLADLGVRFDADRSGRLTLGLEGGHSARRVVHAGGAATGRRLVRQLSALVAEDDRIDVLEGRRVVEVLTAGGRCAGVRLSDGDSIASSAVVLATGGAAALWSRTTNPAGATGGGLLLAYYAGATLADLELMQFHPTAVAARDAAGRDLDGADGFLVTEAIRGEGARLLNSRGERFVDELAPRDEVARAVQRQMALTGAGSVELDMRDVDPSLFPNVVTALRTAGIDPEREPVPVAPAAHYMMGGHRDRPRRPRHRPRPVRRRRVLVHRAPRRQPSRLELAERVLRVRRPRGALGDRRARGRSRCAARRPRRPASAGGLAGESRGAVAVRRSRARPRRAPSSWPTIRIRSSG